MNRRRTEHRGLTNSRIYPKRKRFYLFSADPIENPKTGKISKWHSLCLITEGEDRAREMAKAIISHNRDDMAKGDLPHWVEKYRISILTKREKGRPREAARAKMFEAGSKEISRICQIIKAAFEDFDVVQVRPADVADFVDAWEGRQRMGQIMLSRLSDFIAWCARKGLRDDNPCREVKVEKPASRDRYITDAEFHAIRDALLIGDDGRANLGGPMAQCYVDLCYLLYQRTTEIRLLKWADVSEAGIFFRPTKTEKSSGAKVLVQINSAIRSVLNRAREIGRGNSVYVINTLRGEAYGATGLRSAWTRACVRAKVADATLKDLRAKALTDARKSGYDLGQLQVAAAHTDSQMTDQYIKRREVPVSEVLMELPVKQMGKF